MKTRTHFTFRVDAWTPGWRSIVEHVAGIEDHEVTLATYRAAARCASDRGQPAPARGVGECPTNALSEGNFVRAMLVMPCRKFVSGTLGIGAFVQRKLARLPIR